MNRGHVLLVGVGGTGKKSITKLAAFAAECDVFEIKISRGYNENVFKEDLKLLYNKIGVENRKTVFLFTSGQIVEEGFLEIINNILSVGSVPALFTDDEKDGIVNALRGESEKNGYGASKDGVWNYFLILCSENLHVVLSMPPSGDSLRNRCRNFPGLVGSTYIDWVYPWPEQALFAVSRKFLAEHPKIPENNREAVITHSVHVHQSIGYYTLLFLQKLRRKNYVTPKHFIDFILTFLALIEERDAFIAGQCNRLDKGILKIDEAAEQIDKLGAIVEAQRYEVLASAKTCEEMLVGIEASTETAQSKKDQAFEKSIEVEQKSKQITIEKTEAEEALASALPVLEQARIALEELDRSDITEIRSFATPAEAVQIVCECVVILKGIKDVSWKSAKAMMSESGFLKSLQELNVDGITQKQTTQVRSHMKVLQLIFYIQ